MAIELPAHQRLATIEELLNGLIALHFSPPPKRSTLRSWLIAHRIPYYKSNTAARRGGGTCYYSVPHVEKLICRKVTRLA